MQSWCFDWRISVEQLEGGKQIYCGEVVTKDYRQLLMDIQARLGFKDTEKVEEAIQKCREGSVGALCWRSRVYDKENKDSGSDE